VGVSIEKAERVLRWLRELGIPQVNLPHIIGRLPCMVLYRWVHAAAGAHAGVHAGVC